MAAVRKRIDRGCDCDDNCEQDLKRCPQGMAALDSRVFALDDSDNTNCDKEDTNAEERHDAQTSGEDELEDTSIIRWQTTHCAIGTVTEHMSANDRPMSIKSVTILLIS